MTKKLFGLLVAGVLCGNVHAQTMCGTDELYNKLKKENKKIEVNEAELELYIQQQLQKIDFNSAAKGTAGVDDTTYYDVPIVIHIVHDFGAEYITDNAVFDAVSNWTEVMLGENADTSQVITPFKKWVGTPRIRLHLATLDPNGNPTKGITRRQSYLTGNAGDQAKLDGWPNNMYLNLWFISKFSPDHSGAAAYAYYPSSGAALPYYDGVIGLATYLNYDKAIPHEIGHCLNLQHTWGNNNQPNVACGDDGVDDTPPTKGHLTTGCTNGSLYDTTCATGYVKVVGSTIIDYPDTTNAQNVMDYTYCQKMFTIGQAQRMRIALTSGTAGRNNLFSVTNLGKTGALAPRPDMLPVPDFSVEKSSIISTERTYFQCADNSTPFTFYNRSWNDTIASVQWTFSNGASNPTSASTAFVNNTFSQPGWVTVSITATGNNSGSATKTNTHAVYAADPNTIMPGGYFQGFTAAEMDKWPTFNYYDNQFKWEQYSGAGYNSNDCVRYRSFDDRTSPANKSGTPAGDYDDMFSVGFNLASFTASNLKLNFYTAGARTTKSPFVQDSLQIFMSSDCSKSWKLITTLDGSDLATAAQNAEFFPAAGDWKARTVNLPAANYSDKVFFRFRYWPSENGNNLYMDNFEITPFSTDVNEVAHQPGQVKVFPNPTKGDCELAFTTGLSGKTTFIIKDIAGRVVYQQDQAYAPKTFVQHTISRNVFASAGFYFVTLINDNQATTEKIVVE